MWEIHIHQSGCFLFLSNESFKREPKKRNSYLFCVFFFFIFSRGLATLWEALSVRPLVRWSVGPLVRWSVGPLVMIEYESAKTLISAPAHLSATSIGRVSGLVSLAEPLKQLTESTI